MCHLYGFFQSQETLTVNEWVLRAIVAFIFLLIVARVIGQRAISQLRPLDFAIVLVVGNILAHPLSDEKLGLKGSDHYDHCIGSLVSYGYIYNPQIVMD